MTELKDGSTSSQAILAGDAEAIKHLEESIISGKHWYISLLEAMGLWASAEEVHNGRTHRYLIAGEAFDWQLLAERLCEAVDGLLPDDEKNALIFYSKPPLSLSPTETEKLIGNSKYRQYLNYFYGITVEDALLLTVQEEVHKGRLMLGRTEKRQTADEAYQRIYGATKDMLLKSFRQEKGGSQLKSITLTELKEFTYWLFKYRLKHCEKARVASDTKKAMDYLKRQWASKGFCGALATDESLADHP